MSTEYDDEDYFLPLEDQRVFGAGIRRKRVPFVRSGELSTTTSSRNVADTYLSIVMKQQNKPNTSPSTPKAVSSTEEPVPPLRTHSAPPSHTSSSTLASIVPVPAQDEADDTSQSQSKPPIQLSDPNPNPGYCEVCSLPLDSTTEPQNRPHEASLAHQVCVKHSHPPSHLDRTRAGMRYLSTYGWDPDSRLGLGAAGREGIREPLKGRVKNDTAGLGSGLDKDGDPIKVVKAEPKKVVKLNAKEVRRKEAEAKRRGEKMRNLFFQSDEVLKYLGENA